VDGNEKVRWVYGITEKKKFREGSEKEAHRIGIKK